MYVVTHQSRVCCWDFRRFTRQHGNSCTVRSQNDGKCEQVESICVMMWADEDGLVNICMAAQLQLSQAAEKIWNHDTLENAEAD